MKKKNAFTLTELLLSLAIVGTIAVFAIPPLMNDIHTKVYLNLVKNMSISIEQLAADQMLNTRSHNLANTDFGSPANLLVSKHFAVVNAGDGLLNGSYKSMQNTATAVDGIGGRSILLKNGVVLVYSTPENAAGNVTGTFILDANGNDGPNVIGKDLFVFDITRKGKLISGTNDNSFATCQGGDARACYGYIVNNGWKYPN